MVAFSITFGDEIPQRVERDSLTKAESNVGTKAASEAINIETASFPSALRLVFELFTDIVYYVITSNITIRRCLTTMTTIHLLIDERHCHQQLAGCVRTRCLTCRQCILNILDQSTVNKHRNRIITLHHSLSYLNTSYKLFLLVEAVTTEKELLLLDDQMRLYKLLLCWLPPHLLYCRRCCRLITLEQQHPRYYQYSQ